MKIGMKGDMGVADKMVFLVLGLSACSARNCKQSAPERTYSQLMVARSEGLLLVLGLSAHICARIASECTCLQFMVARSEGLYENLHEGGHWCCQQNGVGFGFEHAQRAYLRAKHASMQIFAVYGGYK